MTKIQISPEEHNGSVALNANIDDMGISFQIIRNRYTEVFDTFNIFQYDNLKGVRSLNFMS